MLNPLEKLKVVSLLSFLQDVDCPSAGSGIKCMVDLSARQEKWLYRRVSAICG